MRPTLLLPLAYVLGFFAAIPIGATQVEIAKRALADRLDTAGMVVIGSVASDVMYGAIALFGLAPFMSDKHVVGVFALVGAGVLLVLAFFTFRHVARATELNTGSPAVRSRPLSLATGFSLAVTNPPIMFWWLVGVKISQDLGLADAFTPRVSTLFLIFGGLGLGSYLSLLAIILQRIKHMISPRAQHRMHVVLGVLLLGLAGYLVITAIQDLRL
jgi:threonine/homoserine/homoserine lactone efflux protein